jgi:hypothetical protein
MSFYCGLPIGGAAMRIMSVIAISAVSVILAAVPMHAAELFLGPGAYPGVYPSLYPGIVAPPYAFPLAREAAPRTGWALDGVRNGTTREERDRHGGPEIDLTGRPILTGRYREFQF